MLAHLSAEYLASLQERFFDKISPEPNSGCWLWDAAITDNGYGALGCDGAIRRAHRIAYELFVGPIPDGQQIDHLCRIRSCVNPVHLEAVTSKVNVLRGVGLPAINARKTHCPKGHPYSGDNLRIKPRGSRHCRACDREHARRKRENRRQLCEP